MGSASRKARTQRGRPATGKAVPAAERMRRYRARRKAAGMKTATSWVSRIPATHSSHRIHDARSLAMHTLIAERISRDPALLEIALSNLRRWSAQRQGLLPAALAEWQPLLAQPWPQLAALLSEQSERAVRLRQSSPFAGILSPEERRRIREAIRA